MSEVVESAGHPVLRRLPGAAWRALPVLAITGVASVGASWLAAWALGPASPVLVPAVLLIAAPAIVLAIGAVQRDVFEAADAPARWWRSVALALGCAALAGASAAWSLVAAAVASAAASALFQITAVAAAVAAAAVLPIAAVALPVAAARPDASIRAIVIAATVAAVRRPLPPVAATLCAAAAGWLGVTWFAGMLVFVVPVFAVVAVAAAWSVAPPIGVAPPSLSPLARRRVAPSPGAA